MNYRSIIIAFANKHGLTAEFNGTYGIAKYPCVGLTYKDRYVECYGNPDKYFIDALHQIKPQLAPYRNHFCVLRLDEEQPNMDSIKILVEWILQLEKLNVSVVFETDEDGEEIAFFRTEPKDSNITISLVQVNNMNGLDTIEDVLINILESEPTKTIKYYDVNADKKNVVQLICFIDLLRGVKNQKIDCTIKTTDIDFWKSAFDKVDYLIKDRKILT